VGKRTQRGVSTWIAAAFAAIVATALPRADAAQLGATVSNVANVSFTVGGASAGFVTAPATFTIQARPTPSTIEFFRISPAAPDGLSVQLSESDYAQDGVAAFVPIGPITMAGGAPVNLSSPVKLVPATDYFAGEPIVVRVTDAGQNGDPNAIETIVATITSATGDRVVLRLYESGPDTGAFYAYIQSAHGAAIQNDPVLAIAQGQDITATYVDPFDATEVSTDVAGVDPFGRLFDSATGAPISGVSVTIVDDATGLPAPVFGVDGVSAYPSTLTTGGTITDAGGMVYSLAPGQFQFPIMFPGRYRLVLAAPAGYSAPSAAGPAQIAALPNGPFVIGPASYLQAFDLTGTGDVEFDVPLDPQTDLIVTKNASVETAAVGDFIRYEIAVENNGAGAALIRVRDALPPGLRYVRGSARANGGPIADPAISPDARTLVFDAGAAPAGGRAAIAYVAEVVPGARGGEAVNRAAVVNGVGGVVSNTAEAAVFIQEDLLRSNLTIAGRVAEDACDPSAKWPRRIAKGKGVPGVRIYMETGAYVVTDENGRFHFEDVDARTHVVQMDRASIPDGYEPVACEANTRFAGSATSQFVDAQGGSLWRANFYLRQTGDGARSAPGAAQAAAEPEPFNDATGHLAFDKAWLETQSGEAAFAYPQEGRTPSARAVHVGVKHPAGTSIKLLANGAPVPPENFAGREVTASRAVSLTRWRGVDIGEGETILTAIVINESRTEIARVTRRIVFVDTIARAEFAAEQSILVADGRTVPLIAVRMTDAAGRPVRAGRRFNVKVDPPYRARNEERTEAALPLSAPLAAESAATVGADGIALIALEPTAQTGRVRLRIALDDGGDAEVSVYLKPALRDWIVVGLAEGTGTLERRRVGAQSMPARRDLIGDGRVAVFAKGAVKGGWLITAQGDTAKKRGEADDELFDAVDPDARYPLFGDRSRQQFEAESRYPIYLKAEKGAFQALLGDYDTNLVDAKLGRYARRMSGVRTVYEGETLSFTGFAAETNQDFVRDELAADGTSGPYRATTTPIVRNSESIIVETRDRFRPDIVKATTPLTRYLDYDIDFRTGEIIFRLPVSAAEGPDSYNVIVVEYETAAPVERSVTAGGRVAHRFYDGRGEIGATVIHEEGVDGLREGGDLAALDATLKVARDTELRLEYGLSRRESSAGDVHDDALIAEIEHRSERLKAGAYYNEAGSDFGLKHQSSALIGVRRYGGELSFRFQEFGAKGGGRTARFVDAKAYREENLDTRASRSVAEVGLRQESGPTSAAVGLRGVVEKPQTGPRRRVLLATLGFRQTFEKIGLTIKASRDQPVASDGQSNFFPKRTILGLDQRLTDKVTLNVSHEIEDREDGGVANTIVGLTAEPWKGGRLTVAGDRAFGETGERLGATFGVDQRVRISRDWSASFGMSRRQELSSDGVVEVPDDIVPDRPQSPFETDGDFTSIYAGLGYQSERTSGSARVEHKKSEIGRRYAVVAGAAREVNDALSFAAASRYEQEENELAADRRAFEARFGGAWRPFGNGPIAFNRFDVKIDNVDGEFESWKAINNLALNFMLDERWQMSLNHGLKYAVLNDGVSIYSGFTQLAGVETRFDITDVVDVGFRGLALYSHNSGVFEYAWGPSIGVSPLQNIWFGFGWNLRGIRDEDFIAAEYAERGPYLQLRIKFDETTAKGLLDLISPESAP
jgi:uncharacterized repeat protein (TIGR01451 family)